jgi:hypothetical protein
MSICPSAALVSVANADRRLASSAERSEKMGIAVSRAGAMAQVLSLSRVSVRL